MKRLKNFEKRLVGEMLASQIISEEQKEIVEFGIVQGVRTLLELFIMLVLGLLFQLFLESLLVLALFIPIRIYAGGYHAKTSLQCALKTWLLFACALIWLKIVVPIQWLEVLTVIVLGILLFVWAPVQHKNKPLKDYEIVRYRRRAFLVWGVEILLMLGGQFVFSKIKMSACVMLAMWMVIILMVAGHCENRKGKVNCKYEKSYYCKK